MTFDFDAKERNFLSRSRARPRVCHHLDGVHWLGFHPLHFPPAGMNWTLDAWLVPHAAIRAMVTHMGRPASRIPIQKETRPAVMVHGFRRARRRHRDFQHAHKCILENHFVTALSGLHGVVAIWEA